MDAEEKNIFSHRRKAGDLLIRFLKTQMIRNSRCPELKLTFPKHFHFRQLLAVRITDLNYGNHVGNDKVLTFLHEARVRFLNSFGYSEFNLEGSCP